ncbi:MAG: TlpA family protein disulfide reductase [Clostridia bacterium]|nr:TlpA family protein disulfide reductase [Clostridia bacterium]
MKRRLIGCLLLAALLLLCSCGAKQGDTRANPLAPDTTAESVPTNAPATDPTSALTTVLTTAPTAVLTTTKPTATQTTTKPSTTTKPTTTPTTTKPTTVKPTTTKPTTTKPTTVPTTVPTTAPTTKRTGETFTFTTTDMDGNAVASADFAGAKVIMVNMWEPWCGPCVGEMPDLQKLYTKYQGQGLVILGVTTSPATDVNSTVTRLGITYPIVSGNAQFNRFDTGYVPTTVFLDGEGHILSEEPYIGSKSGTEWERIILTYLQG